MSAAPVTLVRGAIDAATAAAWLAAVDAHPAWRERRDGGGAAFNPHSSSLRVSAVPGLAPATIAAGLLRGELESFCVDRLGAALTCDIDQSWVRRQYAPSHYPPGHAPHSWHQDGALGVDFLGGSGGPGGDDLLDMVTCWIALTPCGSGAPGLEWVAAEALPLLPPDALRDEAVRARHGAATFRHAVMQPGDCLAFAGDLLHRTHVTAAMHRDRTSLEIRLFDSRRFPARLHGDRFVAVPRSPQRILQ